MKKMIIVLGIVLTMGVCAFGQSTIRTDQVIPIKGIKAFSPEANFLSLPGLVRWQYFMTSGRWMTPREAEEIVANQLKD